MVVLITQEECKLVEGEADYVVKNELFAELHNAKVRYAILHAANATSLLLENAGEESKDGVFQEDNINVNLNERSHLKKGGLGYYDTTGNV